jgi:hypothetical protein
MAKSHPPISPARNLPSPSTQGTGKDRCNMHTLTPTDGYSPPKATNESSYSARHQSH